MAKAWEEDLGLALFQDNAEALRRLIANGLPINERVLEDDFGREKAFTPLHYAAHRGRPNVVAVLIAAGADVNAPVTKDGEERGTPLVLAASRGNVPVLKQLIAAGADVNYHDQYDVTALSRSTGEKKPAYEAVMKVLLAAGARPNYQALVGAARNGSPAMIEMLAAAGADVNEISRWETALILAAHSKRADTTEALLRVGADPRLRVPDSHGNYPGKTALDVAKEMKARKVIPILEGALAGRLPTAPPPKPLDDVPTLWKRVEKAGTPIKKSLNKGATEAKILACEAALGVKFPPDLCASYRIHDGQKADTDGLFPEEFADLDCEFVLLSLDQVAREWQEWKGLHDGGEFKNRQAMPDEGVRDDWWNPKWVPFGSDGGGDSLCVDLDPARGGTAGQVILHQHADNGRSKKATSFQALLQLLAEHLEELASGEE